MSIMLQLTLFGSPVVRYHDQPVTGFRSSKAQALLYYLAVTGWPHTRPTLAGLFWGDQPEAAARTSLSKCLSNLRNLVGDAVVAQVNIIDATGLTPAQRWIPTILPATAGRVIMILCRPMKEMVLKGDCEWP